MRFHKAAANALCAGSARVVLALRAAGWAAAVNGGSRDNVAEKMAQLA
jgi:hypothetical protein